MGKPFSIVKKEPLVFLLSNDLKRSPVTVGIIFLIVPLIMTIWGALYEPQEPLFFISYIYSISWSISMLVLFPIILGLSLHYYRAIQGLFDWLEGLCIPTMDEISKAEADAVSDAASNSDKKKAKQILAEAERVRQDFGDFKNDRLKWFDNPVISVIFAVLALAVNLYYFGQLLSADLVTWLNDGEHLKSIMQMINQDVKHGFTWLGIFAGVIQIILSYWILNLVWRSFMLSWSLHQFFNERKNGSYRFTVAISPMSPDGACGLKQISRVAMIFNLILFLLGIYISLKVADALIIQGGTLVDNIGNPVFLFCYIFLAPLLFFLPLASAHHRMLEAKRAYLEPLAKKREQLIIEAETKDVSSLSGEIRELNTLYTSLDKSIPVWPFNFRSMEAFFVAVITPLLPTTIVPIFKEAFIALFN